MGPRSVAVAAPQRIGRAPKPPACEVSRMWLGLALPVGMIPVTVGAVSTAEDVAVAPATGGGEAREDGKDEAVEGAAGTTESSDMEDPQKMQCNGAVPV